MSFTDLDARRELELLIAFADLTRFAAIGRRHADAELARVIDTFYERVDATVHAAGGVVVKYMGDAALMVFPHEGVDAGVLALLALKEQTDAWLRDCGWDSRLVVKVHFGRAVAGPYGGRGRKRFDVIGQAVNVAATLDSRDFALSAQAFRKLAPETRRHFKKHTPPISYIRTRDRHR